MNAGFGKPCASEEAFTVHVTNADLIAKANIAVWEACRGFAESGDPLGSVLAGLDQAALEEFGLTQRSQILPALQTSVAVWSLRFSTNEAGSGLSSNGMIDTSKLFSHILHTFGDRSPVRHLDGSTVGQAVSPHYVAVDANPTNAKLIENANLAVWDACKAVAGSADPLGPSLLGIDEETLTALGSSSKSRILPIMQTGVPLWSVSLGSAELIKELIDTGGYATDTLFAQVLKKITT